MPKTIRTLVVALTLVGASLASAPWVSAALPDGINYLATQQSIDGSFGNTPTSLASPVQSTAEVPRAYQALGQQAQPPFNPALGFLNADTELNTEFLARRIIVNAAAGNNVTALVNALRVHQNLDGGFGDQAGYDSGILDTAFALEALTLAGVTDATVIAPAVGFLMFRQQASGGWADGDNVPSVYLTAISLRALWYYRHVYVGVPAALTNGKTFLFSQRDGAGLWGDDPSAPLRAGFNTALALLAIIPTLPDLSSVTTSITALQAAQLPNGSWDNDAYTTALALQALYLASLPQTNPDFVTIKGKVVDALTGLPLSGVTVALSGAATASLVTASDGLFLFKDLPAGNYSLQLTLASYATLSATTTATLGQTIDFGVLLMTKGAGGTTGTVQGTVTDAATGAPLAGVSVSATGVATTALTDVTGNYQLANVPAGTVTVTASLAGYAPASATGTLSAGGILNFSPALTAAAATQAATLKGTVTAAATGLPLAGVLISVTGATTAQVTTNAQGGYQITPLNAGAITITASLAGYDTVTAQAQAVTNGTLIFSPKLYATGTTPPDANTAGVAGVVLDAGTNQPLSGVAITARYGATTRNLASDTQGRFTLKGITSAEVSLAFSIAGYVPVTLDVLLEPLEVFDLGQVRLRKEKVTQLLPDLAVTSVNRTAAPTDPNTLLVAGTLSADIANIGTATAPAGITALAFYDANKNNIFDVGDVVLGSATTSIEIAVGATLPLAIPVQGTLPFRDAPIHVFVDSAQNVVELKENNNVNSTASLCEVKETIGPLKPVLKWANPIGGIAHMPLVGPLIDTNGDGKIDQEDTPAIIAIVDGFLTAVSGKDGSLLWRSNIPVASYGVTPALGDLDGDGKLEIVTYKQNGTVIAFNNDGTVKWISSAISGGIPNNTALTIADLDGDGKAEVLAGNLVLNYDGSLRWKGNPAGVSISVPIVVDLDLDGSPEVLMGPHVYRADGTPYWDYPATLASNFKSHAVANFDGDSYPEIVTVSAGYGPRLTLMNHDGSIKWGPVALSAPYNGGAPLVADLDGDGKLEIGIAGSAYYQVFNSDGSERWKQPVYDSSTGAQGSTAFDFNGDGRLKIAYLDQSNFYLFDGATGNIDFKTPNSSGTWIEYPVVADVDNDGHADLVVIANQFFGGSYKGIRVFQNADNSWPNTRRIWNQYAYHVDNVNDDASIPRQEHKGWQTHNTYRVNPRLTASKPDLTASLLRLLDNGTGQPLSLSLRVGNGGAVPSPTGVVTSFYQGDPAAGGVLLGNVTLAVIAPGDYQDIRLDGVVLSGTADLYAVVDSANKVSECDETNNRAKIPLVVSAVRGTIGVSTDSSAYGPNAQAILSATVTNTGALSASFTAQLLIEDTSGAVVTSFPARAVGPVAGGVAVNLTEPWNTGTTLTGNYRLRGRLYNLNATLLQEATAAFTIGAVAGPVVSLRVTTDRPVYNTTDLVAIQNLIANLTTNVIVNNATLRLTIRDPANAVFFTKDGPLGQLVPGALLDIGISVPLSAAPLGLYRVEGKVLDITGAVLATGGTGFEVRVDLSKSLTGKVTVGLPTLEIGTPQTCTDTLTNVGSQAITNLEVHRLLVNLDTQVSHDDRVVTLSLAVGQANTDTRTLATTGLLPGNHACVLQARIDGSLKTLAYAPFVLTVPPIKIDAELRQGSKGRLLVLLDGRKGASPEGDQDPHGPTGAPTLSAQRAFLDARLKQAGWSYTLTETAEDFTREFHSGGYSLYALFTEQEKLAEDTQKELREAVFRGEGLVVAGAHDNRHEKLNDALGVKLIGNVSKAVSAAFPPGPLVLTGSVALLPKDKALRIKRLTAQSLATYVLDTTQTTTATVRPLSGAEEEDDCHELDPGSTSFRVRSTTGGGDDECGGHPENYLDAVVLNTYGQGRVIFAGFDWLATATRDGAGSLDVNALLAALTYTNPVIAPALAAGSAVAVELVLTNRGIATPAVVTLTLPAGVSVLDPGTGTVTSPTTLRWNVTLAVADTQTLTAWLRLPSIPGPLTLTAAVDAGAYHTAPPPLTLTVTAAPTLTDLLARLQALLAANPPEAKALKKAYDELTDALKAPSRDKAIKKAVDAADDLLGLTSPAIVAMRVDLSRWLREAGMR